MPTEANLNGTSGEWAFDAVGRALADALIS